MIIGLSGYAGSGKDTVAKVLVEDYGYTRIAFADQLRTFLYEINPLVACGHTSYLKDAVDAVGWDEAKKDHQIRRLLQDVGLTARTFFGENCWVNKALSGINNADDKIVITDVRFLNEASTIKMYNKAQIWRIARPGVQPVNDHISETSLDSYAFDHTIVNDSGLEDLRQTLKLILT